MNTRNLKWGFGWGLFTGVFFGLIAAVAFVLRKPDEPRFWLIVALYPAIGIMGGAIIGLLRPWITTKARVVLAATLVIMPVVATANVIIDGWPSSWELKDLLGLIVICSMLGLIYGSTVWNDLDN